MIRRELSCKVGVFKRLKENIIIKRSLGIIGSKTLGFLHLLLLFFIFISSPSTFNNKNPEKFQKKMKKT